MTCEGWQIAALPEASGPGTTVVPSAFKERLP
jgi:hypothetical protein